MLGQREYVRQLWGRLSSGEKMTVRDFPESVAREGFERRVAEGFEQGLVSLVRNKYKRTSLAYAKALVRDGVAKGWIG